MGDKKHCVRFFTIADWIEEERWLREEHGAGWKLIKMTPPCFYTFEKCEPEDVIYRLDFYNNEEDETYYQMMEDYGWHYCGRCFGWLYFRKPKALVNHTLDEELFSDYDSRMALLERIYKTRYLPMTIVLLCCVIPGLLVSLRHLDDGGLWLTVFYMVLALLDVYLLVYTGVRLGRMKKRWPGIQ